MLYGQLYAKALSNSFHRPARATDARSMYAWLYWKTRNDGPDQFADFTKWRTAIKTPRPMFKPVGVKHDPAYHIEETRRQWLREYETDRFI